MQQTTKGRLISKSQLASSTTKTRTISQIATCLLVTFATAV